MKRSNSYVFTANSMNPEDMDLIEKIKKEVQQQNKNSTTKKRVVLRGRRPFVKHLVRTTWWMNTNPKEAVRSYDVFGNIVGGLANASQIDVYIYDRR